MAADHPTWVLSIKARSWSIHRIPSATILSQSCETLTVFWRPFFGGAGLWQDSGGNFESPPALLKAGLTGGMLERISLRNKCFLCRTRIKPKFWWLEQARWE